MSRERVACPGCGDNDRNANNLHIFEDDPNSGYCYQCRQKFFIGPKGQKTVRQQRQQKDDAEELRSIKQLPIKALTHKPITLETAERFGVRVRLSEVDGSIERVMYPYFDVDGNVTGYKVRILPKEFVIVGKVKSLFGKQSCKPGARLLVLTEGEDDAMAAWQMLHDAGRNYNVCSIPNGASGEGVVDPVVLSEMEFITSHEIIVLALDNDGPGQATARTLAEVLSSSVKRIKILKMPRKDAGQMLIDGMGSEFEKLFYTKDFHPEKVVRGSELTLESLRAPKKQGIPLPWPKLQSKLQGLRKGEIALITGGSGLGKTQVVRELGFHLADKHNQRIANIMLETPMLDVARSYIAMDNNVPPYKLIFNPKIITEEQYQKSFDRFLANDKLLFLEHWGSLDSEVLLRKMKYFALAMKADWIILDHISLAVAGIDTDERKSLDMAFEALTRLCVETGVGVIVVMHLKRVPGKSWAKGDEVELVDLRGTAGAEQMSWTVLAIERNSQDDGKRDISRLRLIKNRTTGHLGLCDSLSYSHETGRLTLLDSSY